MHSSSSRRIASVCCLLWPGLWAWPPAPARGQEARAAPEEIYALAMPQWVPVRVESVGPDGTTRLVPPAARPPAAADLWTATEGYFLFVSPQLLGDIGHRPAPRPLGYLVRVEVTDVGEGQALTARSGPEAATALKAGDVGLLVRPGRMTTARMRALPAIIPLLKEGDPRAPRALSAGLAEARRAARLNQSMTNLRQIGLALHNFQTAYGQFPPAVVYGPDGRPWHSWRVLILPLLDQRQLFNQYDFTQPWDSPKNRAILNEMPAVYRDPQNGEEAGSSTHYAALVGERTAFSSRGSRLTIANGTASSDLFKGISLSRITDGTSNTIAIAPVDPARKIPWTKPEDIAVGRDFPGLGRPGGIFTPTRIAGDGVAPVLFLDGSVRLLSERTDLATLRALTSMNGGEIIDHRKIIDPPSARRPGMIPVRVLYLIGEGKDVSAMIGPAPTR
jgi:hypothetical protein